MDLRDDEKRKEKDNNQLKVEYNSMLQLVLMLLGSTKYQIFLIHDLEVIHFSMFIKVVILFDYIYVAIAANRGAK